MEASCEGCKKLWLFLTDIDSHGSLKKDEFSSEDICLHHRYVLQNFLPLDSPYSGKISTTGGIGIVEAHGDINGQWRIWLVKNALIPDHPGTGVSLDPDWVDTNLLLQWKHVCLEGHGKKCDNPLKIWPTRPAWLIDVKDKCLVSGSKSDLKSGGSFVALSYTYGTGSSLKIDDAATLTRLQTPNSLILPEISSSISPVIKHGMYLTAVLGEHYLWADALCIPHFDKVASVEQLNLMGAIYANATFTIITTSTDSNEGLLGLRGVSNSRRLKQRVIPFGADQIVARGYTGSRHLFAEERPYNYRAWTHQEYLMSPRKLIFDKYGLLWECSCGCISEGQLLNTEVSKLYGYRVMDKSRASFPEPQAMHQILMALNRKDLTFDTDALASVAGLLSVFSRPFRGGFLYGLPEWMFDSALGWRVHHGPSIHPQSGTIRRRGALPGVREQDHIKIGPCGLPSWSWIGWHGPISEDHCDNARIYNDVKSCARETYPITQWFTAGSPTVATSKRRPISSTWSVDREKYKDPNQPLPPGWTRYENLGSVDGFDPNYADHPESCGSFFFQHEAMNKKIRASYDSATNWWHYPVPVADLTAPTPPLIPEQTEYLFCTTFRAHLWGARCDGNPLWREPGSVDLLNAGGRIIGFLEPMEDKADFPTVGKDDKIRGMQVELVAISRLKDNTRTRYKDTKVVGDVKITESIAVLWVEWINGVAYRLGYGEVEKEEWDKLPLDCIELVL
ncbi:heterokaryon incompatibility protein-domain-containing protein, partial [Nemania sp. FL0916]